MAQLDLKIERMRISSQSERSLNLSSSSSSSSQHLKLPKFDLPVFSGDPLNWQGFWDQFDVFVHSKEALSDIDRFNYLKRYLRGEALSAVSGLSLCSENYKEAMKILKQRHGNQQVLVSAHMSSLLKLTKIRKSEDIKGLRKLHDDVENCMRNLNALNQDASGYGGLLIPLMKEKLPDDLMMVISRRFGSEIWTGKIDGVFSR